MEWKVIQKNLASSLLWLLVLSTILLLFILYSLNPYIINTGQGFNQNPALNHSMMHSIQSTALLAGQNQSILQTETIESPPPFTGHSQTNKPSPLDGGHEEVSCDLSTGKWVKDSRGPMYTNSTCPTLPDLKNCLRYGKDPAYIYWRWKPDGCELPIFEPSTFLRIVRGKKMAFIGDSLARNQMDSLLCLLSQEETPTNTYRDDRAKLWTWYFPSHDFTLKVMWTEFFVEGIERIINGTSSNAFEIHLDRINTNWTKELPGLNYVVISGGNWFFRKNYLYENGRPTGCILCKEPNLTDHGPLFAIRKVLRKALQSISECKDCERLVTFIRTYTPSHFEHGSWFTGGYCNRTQPLSNNELDLAGKTWDIRNIQVEEMERLRDKVGTGKKKFVLLDVTKAMMARADAHPGSFWDKKWMKGSNDCLHWCMPGPVDMWNDLLLTILKRDSLL